MSILFLVLVLLLGAADAALGQKRFPTEKPGPQKSGFYTYYRLLAPDFSPGVGQVSNVSCTVGAATQPSIYSGNMLLDCDGEVPHNETTMVVNPTNPSHAVGGYHGYQLSLRGATAVLHVVSTASVTFDGGLTWREVVPPLTPYQFSGDPALAFDSDGRLYYASIADHEGPGGSFTGPSIVVSRSNDGGLTWSNPVTVSKGKGAVAPSAFLGNLIFNDKEFIAADKGATSPFRNRVYVTWSKFEERINPGKLLIRVPILASWSNNGVTWSAPREISGFSAHCSVTLFGRPNECDLNQDSYPTVAPNGRVYVSFENFNTPAENQLMVVRSNNGGMTWSNPVRVDTIFDINFPANADGRDTLTGCQLRYSSVANSAADPSDPTGNTVYVVWADNRNGTVDPGGEGPEDDVFITNTDIFLGRSTDGGATWTVYTIDDAANDQFYPWVAVAPDGRVDIGYMDRAYSAGQSECKYGFTLARVTFAGAAIGTLTKQRVDTGLSHSDNARWFSFTTGGNTLFIGDYNGVAVGSDGATWSLWTDQRNTVLNPPAPNRNHGQHAVGAKTGP